MSCKLPARLRIAALLVATAVLRGDSCGGNLGENEPGPVTFRLSVASGAVEADGESGRPSISADGRFVAFSSKAGNLSASAVGLEEVYVRDRAFDVVINVSRLIDLRDPDERAPCINPALSANGNFVVFQTSANLLNDSSAPPAPRPNNLFVRNMTTGNLRQVIPAWPANGAEHPSISGDGRYVVFESADVLGNATNTNSATQVYVADLSVDPPVITLVSRSLADATVGTNAGARGAHISENGTTIVFISRGLDMHPDVAGPVFPPPPLNVYAGTPAGDPVALVSRASGASGAPADQDCEAPFVNAAATHVAFVSVAANLGGSGLSPAVYVRDLTASTTSRDAEEPFVIGFTFDPIFLRVLITFADRVALSADGGLLAYTRAIPGPSPVDPPQNAHIVVRNRLAATDRPVSVGPVGGPGNGFSFSGMLSSDGRWAVFQSIADNLVLRDTNGVADVFGHGPLR